MNNLNPKNFPIGTVVYFVEQEKNGFRKVVRFGTVLEHYSGEIAIQLYDFKETRTINGIPYNEFETPTRWKKLPKNWTYNTELFKLSNEKLNITTKDLSPESIITEINAGNLVPVNKIDYSYIEVEYDNHSGYRLVRKYESYDYHADIICVQWNKIYATWEEAQKIVDEYDSEMERQKNLSDYDWSVEQIDNALNRWVNFYNISSEEKESIRNRLLALGNIEDLEVRIFGQRIQWKYWKNKKWNNMENNG